MRQNTLVHFSFDSPNPRITKIVELLSIAARFGKVLVCLRLEPMVAIADYADNLIYPKIFIDQLFTLHFPERYHL